MPVQSREGFLKMFKFTKIVLTQMAYQYSHFNFYKQTKYAGYGKTGGFKRKLLHPKDQ